MKILSRAEELILLTIWRLKENAYCVPIFEKAQKHTGKKWSLGGVYIPLGRLEKKGYIISYLGEPSSERGGKRKRFYKVTPAGLRALKTAKEVEKSMWEGLEDILPE